MRALAVAVALVAALVLTRAAIAGDDAAAAIKSELSREVSAWNAGDLDGYLAGYERATTTTMIGRAKIYRGWDAIAAMYRDRFGDRKRMGTLGFSELEVRPLAPDYALAIGRWDLQRGKEGGGPAGGFFTLTLHKSVAGWRIVLDHTS
jgi:ketosteroid isomerase-like protein